MHKVIVVTRTKDRPIFLKRAIKSVHSQSYTDFAHVIINDGGVKGKVDDVVAAELDQVSRKKVHVIHNDTSEGMEAATNKAIRSLKSEYVSIHDDDDSWHADFLKSTVQALDEMDKAMGVVVRADKVIEELSPQDGAIRTLNVKPWMPQVSVINLYRQCIDNQMTPITFVYRRSALDEIGYYDESLPVCGDWDFGIRFLQKYHVEFIDPGYALAYYHHRKFRPGVEGNTSYTGNEKARYYTNVLANKYLRKELADGRLGVGYIMSKLRYEDDRMSMFASRLLPGRITKILKKKVSN